MSLRKMYSSGTDGARMSRVNAARQAPPFEFEALESMPCGCVAAAYRSTQWDVSLVSLEAKGPHCVSLHHMVGQVLQLGDSYELRFDDQEA